MFPIKNINNYGNEIVNDAFNSWKAPTSAASHAKTQSDGGGNSIIDGALGLIGSAATGGQNLLANLLAQGRAEGQGSGQGYGAGSTVSRGPSQAELNSVLSNLGTLDQTLANRNQTAQDTYNQAIKSYDDTFALDRQARDKAVTQNEQSNTDARQAAMVQAAVGGRGLHSVLASMGALGGTGLQLADQAVAREANIDIGNADKNFQTNASNLTDTWARAKDEDRKRRAEADTALANTKTNNAADIASSRQSMYNQLAGMYDRGTSEANSYLAKASALSPQIAAGSRQAVTPYAKSQQLFAPGQLQEYLGGVRDLSVGASAAPSGQSGSPINSPLFGQSEDKRRQIGVA